MGKPNDFIAIMLNSPDFTAKDLYANNITPKNTQLMDKDYYKNIAQVQNSFKTKDGKFDDKKFNDVYNSAVRVYNDWSDEDYEKMILNAIPVAASDITHSGNSNVYIPDTKIIPVNDPWRSSHGLESIQHDGTPSFDIREVAQENKVVDANGNELDWTPNDEGGFFKGLARPDLVLAQWDEDGVSIENGQEVFHVKGQYKLKENGNPYYEINTGKEAYSKERLHYWDTITKENSSLNKIDLLDSDSLEQSAGKTILQATAKLVPYLIPYVGPALGALGAVQALAQGVPVLTKAIYGIFGGKDDSAIYKDLTKVENFADRFTSSQSRESQNKPFGFESIVNIIPQSVAQLYQQKTLWKIPGMMKKIMDPEKAAKFGVAYMALTSATDSYGTFKEAGANEQMAGIGYLATLGAYYTLMNQDYFRKWLVKDMNQEGISDINRVVKLEIKNKVSKILPELQKTVNKAETVANKGVSKVTSEAAAKFAKVKTEVNKKWFKDIFKTTYNKVDNWITTHGVPGSAFATGSDVLNRSLNEGTEEVMEEIGVDLSKGLTQGLEWLGIKATKNKNEKLDYNWSSKDIFTRYFSNFIGGAIGGAAFQGIELWNDNVINGSVPKLYDTDIDHQYLWYIANGKEDVIKNIIEKRYKKDLLGNPNLSYTGKFEKDSNGNYQLLSTSSKEGTSQNDQIYNALMQHLDSLKGSLRVLGMDVAHNDLILGGLEVLSEKAKAENLTVEEYQKKHYTNAALEAIENSKVGDFIFDDYFDLQTKAVDAQTSIDRATAEIRSKYNDNNKAAADEAVKKDRFINSQIEIRDKAVKEFNDILSGKNSYKYKSYMLFLTNSRMKKLYLFNNRRDIINKEMKTRKDNDMGINLFTRALYGYDYDSPTITDADRKDIEKQYAIFDNDKQTIEQYKKGFEVHNSLQQQYKGIISDQLKTLKGSQYDYTSGEITLGNMLSEELEKLVKISEDLNKQIENAGGLDNAPIELKQQALEVQNNLFQLNKLIRNPVLSFGRITQSESDKDQSYDQQLKQKLINANDTISNMEELSKILDFVESYYKLLKNKNIVSLGTNGFLDRSANDIISTLADEVLSKLTFLKQQFDEYQQLSDNLADLQKLQEGNISQTGFEEKIKKYLSEQQLEQIDNTSLDIVNKNILKMYFSMLNLTKDFVIRMFGKEALTSTTIHNPITDFYWKIIHAGDLVYNSKNGTFETNFGDNDLPKTDIFKISNFMNTGFDTFAGIEEYTDVGGIMLNESSDAADPSLSDIYNSTSPLANSNSFDEYNDAVQVLFNDLLKNPYNVDAALSTFESKIVKNSLFKVLGLDKILEKLKKLQEIKKTYISDNVKTPVTELLKRITMDIDADHSIISISIIEQLEKELKHIQTFDDVYKYCIDNKITVDAFWQLYDMIDYLQDVLFSALDSNAELNKYLKESGKEADLPVLADKNVLNIYLHDLRFLQNEIAQLLQVSMANHDALMKEDKNSMITMLPLYIKYFVDIDNPEDPNSINNKLKSAFTYTVDDTNFTIDLVDLWKKAQGDQAIDLNNIDETNIKSLVDVETRWRDLIYDEFAKIKNVKNINIQEILTKVINALPDFYKNNNSKISSTTTDINSIDALYYIFESIILKNSDFKKELEKQYIPKEGETTKIPFYQQEASILLGSSFVLDDINAFQLLIDQMKDAYVKVTLDVSDKEYLSQRIAAHALMINGGSGTGKTSVVAKMIHDIAINHGFASAVSCTYESRLRAFEQTLNKPDDSGVTIDTVISKLRSKYNEIQHTRSSDVVWDDNVDYIKNQESSNKNKTIYVSSQLSPKTLEEAKKVTFNDFKYAYGINTKSNKIVIFIDEATFMTAGQLQFLSAAADAASVNGNVVKIVLDGDLKQNGAIYKYTHYFKDGKTKSRSKISSLEDCYLVISPELTVSFRQENSGKLYNYHLLSSSLDVFINFTRNNPTATLHDIDARYDKTSIEFHYFDNKDSKRFFGDYFLTNIETTETYIEKFIEYLNAEGKDPKNNLIIIADEDKINSDKYNKYKTAGIQIVSPTAVQGFENEYVVIDVDFGKMATLDNETSKFLTVRNLYTLITRAQRGSAIGYDSYLADKNTLGLSSISTSDAVIQHGLNDAETQSYINDYINFHKAVYANYLPSENTEKTTVDSKKEVEKEIKKEKQLENINYVVDTSISDNPKSVKVKPIVTEKTLDTTKKDELDNLNADHSAASITPKETTDKDKSNKKEIDENEIDKKTKELLDTRKTLVENNNIIAQERFNEALKNKELDKVITVLFDNKDSNADKLLQQRNLIKYLSGYILKSISKEKPEFDTAHVDSIEPDNPIIKDFKTEFNNQIKKYIVFQADKNSEYSYLYYIFNSNGKRKYLPIAVLKTGKNAESKIYTNLKFSLEQESVIVSSNGKKIQSVEDFEKNNDCSVSTHLTILDQDLISTALQNTSDFDDTELLNIYGFKKNQQGKLLVTVSDNPQSDKEDAITFSVQHNENNKINRVYSDSKTSKKMGVQAVMKLKDYLNYCQMLGSIIRKESLENLKEITTVDTIANSNWESVLGPDIATRFSNNLDDADRRSELWKEVFTYKALHRITTQSTVNSLFTELYNYCNSEESKNDEGVKYYIENVFARLNSSDTRTSENKLRSNGIILGVNVDDRYYNIFIYKNENGEFLADIFSGTKTYGSINTIASDEKNKEDINKYQYTFKLDDSNLKDTGMDQLNDLLNKIKDQAIAYAKNDKSLSDFAKILSSDKLLNLFNSHKLDLYFGCRYFWKEKENNKIVAPDENGNPVIAHYLPFDDEFFDALKETISTTNNEKVSRAGINVNSFEAYIKKRFFKYGIYTNAAITKTTSIENSYFVYNDDPYDKALITTDMVAYYPAVYKMNSAKAEENVNDLDRIEAELKGEKKISIFRNNNSEINISHNVFNIKTGDKSEPVKQWKLNNNNYEFYSEHFTIIIPYSVELEKNLKTYKSLDTKDKYICSFNDLNTIYDVRLDKKGYYMIDSDDNPVSVTIIKDGDNYDIVQLGIVLFTITDIEQKNRLDESISTKMINCKFETSDSNIYTAKSNEQELDPTFIQMFVQGDVPSANIKSFSKDYGIIFTDNTRLDWKEGGFDKFVETLNKKNLITQIEVTTSNESNNAKTNILVKRSDIQALFGVKAADVLNEINKVFSESTNPQIFVSNINKWLNNNEALLRGCYTCKIENNLLSLYIDNKKDTSRIKNLAYSKYSDAKSVDVKRTNNPSNYKVTITANDNNVAIYNYNRDTGAWTTKEDEAKPIPTYNEIYEIIKNSTILSDEIKTELIEYIKAYETQTTITPEIVDSLTQLVENIYDTLGLETITEDAINAQLNTGLGFEIGSKAIKIWSQLQKSSNKNIAQALIEILDIYDKCTDITDAIRENTCQE